MKLDQTFFYLACAGWFLGTVVHITSIFGYDPGNSVWALHIGIFIVWIPCILRIRQNNPQTNETSNFFRWGEKGLSLNKMFRHAPIWMKIAVVLCFVYAMINFVVMVTNRVSEHIEDPATTVRIFSGHWIVFYSAAAAGLFPAPPNQESETN